MGVSRTGESKPRRGRAGSDDKNDEDKGEIPERVERMEGRRIGWERKAMEGRAMTGDWEMIDRWPKMVFEEIVEIRICKKVDAKFSC